MTWLCPLVLADISPASGENSPQDGNGITPDQVVGSDDEHVVGDGLGDDDAVEGVSMDVWQF